MTEGLEISNRRDGRTERSSRWIHTCAAAWWMLLMGIGCAGLMAGCGSGEPEFVFTSFLPDSVAVEDPDRPLTDMGIVEDMTEEVADRLLTFSDKLRRRDFTAASAFLGEDFAGHSLAELPVLREESLPLEVEQQAFDPSAASIVSRDDFMDALRAELGPWSRVLSALWKVKRAEFQAGAKSWGKLRLYVHVTGRGPGGEWISLSAWGHARAVREKRQWVLDRFELESLTKATRAGTIFTDVSAAAGVAHTGPRFGKKGNQSYAFNGAACGDVDGDGLFDVFVPSDGRNYLYMARPDGTFAEEAEARGVHLPDAGTGAVLFDLDEDGDQDLLVGQVGWREPNGEPGGRSLALYRNVGEGRFEDATEAFGLADLRYTAYSLAVLDFDADGWLDIYVCGYGRVEEEHNNSWIEATNGSPNGLLRNLEGRGFADVADELGVRGSSWSYAAAAADVDADGDTDLYVANDYGTNRLYRNDGGRFVDIAVELGVEDPGNGMGVAWGDLNADGRLDLYVSNMSSTAGSRILSRLDDELSPEVHAMLKKLSAGNSIFLANADGTFQRRPSSAGGLNGSWAWSPAIFDLNLDGFLDVYCANGFITGDQPFDT